MKCPGLKFFSPSLLSFSFPSFSLFSTCFQLARKAFIVSLARRLTLLLDVSSLAIPLSSIQKLILSLTMANHLSHLISPRSCLPCLRPSHWYSGACCSSPAGTPGSFSITSNALECSSSRVPISDPFPQIFQRMSLSCLPYLSAGSCLKPWTLPFRILLTYLL